jgi:hypothetical protein
LNPLWLLAVQLKIGVFGGALITSVTLVKPMLKTDVVVVQISVEIYGGPIPTAR